jgi:hypothetical protein
MNVLLLSMPDSFEHMPSIVIRMPNGALSSIAGNIDSHHKVAVGDLILVQQSVRETVERLVHEIQPDVVGLSVMTFQRKTAGKIIDLIHSLKPGVRVAVEARPGSAPKSTQRPNGPADFIVGARARLRFGRCCGR